MNTRILSCATVLLALLILLFGAGCPGKTASTSSGQDNSRASSSSLPRSEFDADRAFEHVRKQVEFGPRPPGSAEIKKTQSYIISQLESYGIKVIKDSFQASTPQGTVQMMNIIGELPGERPEIIIIASHYDTKPTREFKFVGANDGGSSTGALLEIARVLSRSKPPATLWFTFFDGEEAFVQWSDTDSRYGSRRMVEKLRADKKLSDVKAMILLDMIGDKDLDIKRESNSSAWLTSIIWNTAGKLGYEKHFQSDTQWIDDDHIPFLRAGVPAVDIIDFNYGHGNQYWHTAQDTLDKVSPQSLKIVGDVVILSLPEIAKRLK